MYLTNHQNIWQAQFGFTFISIKNNSNLVFWKEKKTLKQKNKPNIWHSDSQVGTWH